MKRSINKLRVGRTVHQGLCILGESDHFGEDEIFKKTCRKSSAFVYSSTSEIYYISTKVIVIYNKEIFQKSSILRTHRLDDTNS